jgi:hypothetical protein
VVRKRLLTKNQQRTDYLSAKLFRKSISVALSPARSGRHATRHGPLKGSAKPRPI